MRAFNELRKSAREKRDKAIALANQQYQATLVQIATLEQDMLGSKPTSYQTVSSCIDRVLPRDRAFTTLDVITALEAMDPGRVWHARAVDHQISRLRSRGIVKRLRRQNGHERALYAVVGVEAEAPPFGDKTLPQVMAEVLAGRTLTQTELTVAIIEAGYHSVMKPKMLRVHVGTILRKDPQFTKRGEKWGASGH